MRQKGIVQEHTTKVFALLPGFLISLWFHVRYPDIVIMNPRVDKVGDLLTNSRERKFSPMACHRHLSLEKKSRCKRLYKEDSLNDGTCF